jgi:hypothetical protein
MSGSALPPRLSTRLLLSLYGEQRSGSVQELRAKRTKLLTEIENEDVIKPLTVEAFLHSSMPYEVVQKVKRTYMTFLKEVTAVEAGNTFPNAAKTLYSICKRNLSSKVNGQKEASSYFGYVSDAQFEAIWPLVEELSEYAKRNEMSSTSTEVFGEDLVIQPPAVNNLTRFYGYVSGIDRLCRAEPAEAHHEAITNMNALKGGELQSAAPSLSPVQQAKQSSRMWLRQLCEAHVAANPGGPFDATQLANSIIAACDQAASSDSAQEGEAQLQMALFDLIGEAGFELMLEIIQQRARIVGLGSVDAKEMAAAAGPARAQAIVGPPAATDMTDADRALIASLSDADTSAWDTGAAGDENLSANQRRKREQKEARALERAMAESSELAGGEGADGDWLQQLGFDDEYLLEERALGLQKGRSLHAIPENWLSNLAAEGTTQVYEKRGLPAGTERFVRHDHEEVAIPAASRPAAPKEGGWQRFH